MFLLLALFLLVAPDTPVTATPTPSSAQAAGTPEDAVLRLTPDELQVLVDRNDAVIVDVRGDVPYGLHHIRGAISLPLGLVGKRAHELPQDKVIVAYCSCKQEETSLIAALELQKAGFERTAVLKGGYQAWANAGLAVDLAPPDPDATPMPPPGETEFRASASSAARGRLMPPPQVPCDRSELTVYPGRVLSYNRGTARTTVRIRTDHDTTETVTLRHPRKGGPSSMFLLNQKPFQASDWKRIERRKGVLRAGMRAHAWVCESGEALLDWRPDDAVE